MPCRPCVAAVLAFVIAQTLKLFTYWYSERRWDFTRLIGSGGMPSSHTGCVSFMHIGEFMEHAASMLRCLRHDDFWNCLTGFVCMRSNLTFCIT